jgi:hypothetical protein
MSTELTKADADALLAMEKQRENPEITYDYPTSGGRVMVPLTSTDGRERFILDISRRNIQLTRNKFQVRGREVYVLARLDLDDTPHRNPDGEEIPGPHLHLYKEGFGDKWACPLPEDFTSPDDCMLTFRQFLVYCRITDLLLIDTGFLP